MRDVIEARPLQVLLQAVAVAVLAVLLYSGLRSELPVDDVLRFTPGVAAGVYEWDSAHLLMQPAAVLWHRHLGFGAPARTSQERFNAFCAALSLAILYLLLLRLEVDLPRRLLLTALGALAFNQILLGTSGHFKLAVLPFLTLSLYHGVLWERGVRQGGREGGWRLAASALFLGLAAAFLVNSIVVAPFLGVAVAAVSVRAGSGWQRALARLLGVGMLSGGTALAALGTGYWLTTPGAASLRGLLGFFLAKGERWPESCHLAVRLSRGVFGVLQNFVYLGDFGAMVRTWMSGDGALLGPQRGTLLVLGALFVVALALLGWVYGEGALRLLRGGGLAVPWAFVLGALAFAVAWNLNEADFYFPLTFPSVVMMAAAPVSPRRWVLEAALVTLVSSTVLAGWAIPRKGYPLYRYNAELRAGLTGRDLLVLWSHWAGGPSLLFMELPGVERLYPDKLFYKENDPEAVFPGLANTLDRRFAAGGRVYLFDVLDREFWNAPWPRLRRRGLDPGRWESFFRERYTVIDRGEVAEIPCWELRPRAGRALAPPPAQSIGLPPGGTQSRNPHAQDPNDSQVPQDHPRHRGPRPDRLGAGQRPATALW